MKKFILSSLTIALFFPCYAQKIVSATEFKLSEFEKLASPSQVVGLKLNGDNKVVVYALKLIPGTVNSESTAPKEEPKKGKNFLGNLAKGALKVNSALNGATFTGKDAYVGLPYLSQRTFDADHKQVSNEGELVLITAKEENMKYSFEPNFFAEGITKKMEVKSSLKDMSEKNALVLANKFFVSADITHSGKGLLGDKEPKAYLQTIFNDLSINPTNGLIAMANKVETPNKEVNSPKLPYCSMLRAFLPLSNTSFQAVVYEKKENDKWSSLKNYRLITIGADGNTINDEDMNLQYIKKLQNLIPIYDTNGDKNGSLIVFMKQAALGGKDLKDPIEGNRNIFIADAKGKIQTKFDYLHAKGEGIQPFDAIAAMAKDDKLFVLNVNMAKLSNISLETVVLDKTGKAEVTHSTPSETLNPKIIGNVQARKYVGDARYSNTLKGENGHFYLIGQRFAAAADPTPQNQNPQAQYGDLFITELDADFKYQTHTIVAFPNSYEAAKIDILEKKDDKITFIASALNSNDAVVIINQGKVNAVTGILPVGMVHPIIIELSKNYVFDALNNSINFVYQSKTENNKGKIVKVSTATIAP